MLLLTILLVICLIFGVIGFITENTGMLITGIVARRRAYEVRRIES